MTAWWRHLGGGPLRVFAVRAGGRLVGLLPMFVFTDGSTRRLLPLGISVSDRFDVLVAPGYSGAVTDALDRALSRPAIGWDRCEWHEVPVDGTLRGMSSTSSVQSVSPVLDVARFAALPARSGVKRRLSRARHRAAEARLQQAGRHKHGTEPIMSPTTHAPARVPTYTVTVELNFLVRSAEKPRSYAYDSPDGAARSNARYVPHRVPICDARPNSALFSLDAEGFAFVGHRSAVSDLWEEDEVRRIYYREAERLLIEATGADRVFVFDHTLRLRVPGMDDRTDGQPRQPATRVHVDQPETVQTSADAGVLRAMNALRPWTVLNSKLMFANPWLRVRSERCRTGRGDVIGPYHVIEYPDWITVVPLTAEGRLLLREYRHGVGAVLTGLPGGLVDPADGTSGTPAETAARRELLEETGYGGGTLTPLLAFLTAFAVGAPLRAIGAARPSPAAQAILVKADVPYRSVADLRGRKVAGNRGGWGQYLVRSALKQAGVAPGDIELVLLPPPDAALAFRSGAVDAWAVWDLYVWLEVLWFGARTLVNGQGLTPAIMLVVAHEGAIRTKRAVLADFLRRFDAGWPWANEHHPEYAKYNAALTGLPEPVLRRTYETERTTPVPLTPALIEDLQAAANALEFGLLRQALDVRQAFDTRFDGARGA